jgi:hypothetical protein
MPPLSALSLYSITILDKILIEKEEEEKENK